MAVAGETVHCFECFSTLIDRHDGPAANFIKLEEYVKTIALTNCVASSKFSKPKPLDPKLLHGTSTFSKSSLKSNVRAGVDPSIRRRYWLGCLKIRDEDVVLYSKALGESALHNTSGVYLPYGVPSFSSKPTFSDALKRVLNNTMPHAKTAPLIPIIAHVLLHMLEEWECYVALQRVITRQGWADKNEVESTASLQTLIKLSSTHCKSAGDIMLLKPVGMSEMSFLMDVFSNWYMWPFTTRYFWFTIRVMDLYMLEGPKLLYRLALAALNIYLKSDFYIATKEDIPPISFISYFIADLSLEDTCQWLNQALNLPRLNSDTLMKLWLQNCLLAQERNSISPLLLSNGSRELKQQTFVRELKVDSVSEVLEQQDCAHIEKWLPDWVQGNALKCLFQASRNGYNLRTLYHECEDSDSLILVIKSSTDAVFGAFIAGDLKDRHNNSFFGLGETFLFTLKPESVVYRWTAESDLILRGNDEEIIIGSGGGQFGLWIDGDLDRGSSATCTSFSNQPLTGDGTVDFKCSCVEVFSVITTE